jgi:hypothetical protein
MSALVPVRAAPLPARLPTGRALVPAPQPPKEGMRDAARRYQQPAQPPQGGRILDLIV